MQLCRKCGTRLDPVAEKQEYHPWCFPEHVKLPGTSMSLYEMAVREDLLELIQWGNQSSARSMQTTLGCSEAGNECRRRIAMTMAGFPKVNFPDPLKANMGTAFHNWLDLRMEEFQSVNGISEWITETEVWPASFLKGHVDLYSKSKFLVLDWKTTSSENLRKWMKGGIPTQYLVQIMLYGKGMTNLGYRVDRVGLVGIDRSGALRDVQVLTVPYDEAVARAALLKVWEIGKQIHGLSVVENPQKISEVESAPSRMCAWCPYYRGGKQKAGITGCPGQNESVDSLFN